MLYSNDCAGGLTPLRKTTIDLLKRYGIVKTFEKPILLSSGKQSNFYVDMREAAGIPILFNYITTLAAKKLNKYETKQLIGLELFGAIYAHTIGMKAGIDTCSLRKEAKKHGMSKLLEGYICDNIQGKDIILIDDVLTTGSSIIKGVNSLELLTYTVKKAFVLVDRQEGGREELEARGIRLESLFTREELI